MKNVDFAIFVLILAAMGGGYWWVEQRRATPADVVRADLCRHKLAPLACPFCTPTLVESDGECRAHRVPEALCWICRPALLVAYQAENDWCAEHACPESRCDICRGPGGHQATPAAQTPAAAMIDECCPAPAAGGAAPAPKTASAADLRSARGITEDCDINSTVVQLRSPEVAQSAGITTVAAARRAITRTVRCNAEVAYDARRYARIAPRVGGVVREVRVDLGEIVQAGDVVAIIDSPELAAAKADYQQALALKDLYDRNLQRYERLAQQNLTTDLEMQEAETRAREAEIGRARTRQRLQTLGLSAADVDQLAESGDTGPILAVTAPFDGEIVERFAVLGELADPTRPLFAVADTSTMWVMLDWAQPGAGVAVGSSVQLRIDGLPERDLTGRVTWVSTSVDPQTRTLRARAEFENAERLLRANMFGTADVLVAESEDLLTVPRGAVQWDGGCNIVFVQQTPVRFATRPIEVTEADETYYAVRSGLEAGERVVVGGAYLLKTEILKGEIGAGCCPPEPK